MVKTTKLVVVGYGALGAQVLEKAGEARDMTVVGVVSRRHRELDDLPCYVTDSVSDFTDYDPIAVMCTESEYLIRHAPNILRLCDTVDSFDMHGLEMLQYFSLLEDAARGRDRVALYALGWDPGLFSIARLMFGDILPRGDTEVNYGVDFPNGGVSRGHSAVLNRVIDGVKLACSRTFPRKDGKIVRRVYIALAAEKIDGSSYGMLQSVRDSVRDRVMEHPYFKNDDVRIHFTSEAGVERLLTDEHSGLVQMIDGKTTAELKLVLDNSPGFTAQILINGARACSRMRDTFGPGAYNMTQIPPTFFSQKPDGMITREVV